MYQLRMAENLIALPLGIDRPQSRGWRRHCPESLQAVEFRGNDIIVVIRARL